MPTKIATVPVRKHRVSVIQGDITKQSVDAIVNAANASLLGGGGVDGAIHRTAGPELLAECRTLGGCGVGEARITRGYELPAKFVIHTVGPVWRGGADGEPLLLASCYKSVLSLAQEHRIETIAFPSIGTGAFGYPIDQACRIALLSMRAHLVRNPLPWQVTIVCFSDRDVFEYESAFHEIIP